MLTDAQFRARMRHENEELMKMNTRPNTLKIEAMNADLTKYKITVNAPSYIHGPDDKPVLSHGPHILTMTIERDYPFISEDVREMNRHKPRIAFVDPSKRCTHINVFPSGAICTGDHFNPRFYNLCYLVDKAMYALSFTPETFGYRSMADSAWANWMRDMQKKGVFPTFQWPFIGMSASSIVINVHK